MLAIRRLLFWALDGITWSPPSLWPCSSAEFWSTLPSGGCALSALMRAAAKKKKSKVGQPFGLVIFFFFSCGHLIPVSQADQFFPSQQNQLGRLLQEASCISAYRGSTTRWVNNGRLLKGWNSSSESSRSSCFMPISVIQFGWTQEMTLTKNCIAGPQMLQVRTKTIRNVSLLRGEDKGTEVSAGQISALLIISGLFFFAFCYTYMFHYLKMSSRVLLSSSFSFAPFIHSFIFYPCFSCTQGSAGEHPSCLQVKVGY